MECDMIHIEIWEIKKNWMIQRSINKSFFEYLSLLLCSVCVRCVMYMGVVYLTCIYFFVVLIPLLSFFEILVEFAFLFVLTRWLVFLLVFQFSSSCLWHVAVYFQWISSWDLALVLYEAWNEKNPRIYLTNNHANLINVDSQSKQNKEQREQEQETKNKKQRTRKRTRTSERKMGNTVCIIHVHTVTRMR